MDELKNFIDINREEFEKDILLQIIKNVSFLNFIKAEKQKPVLTGLKK
jgi:hypothetical protein